MIVQYTDTDYYYNGTSVISFSACDFPIVEGIVVRYEVFNIIIYYIII